MYQEKGWPLLTWNPTLQTVTPSWAIVLLVLSVSLNGQSLILHSSSVARVKTWRGLRSHKTSVSGWVSGLRWYISPNKEVVRWYCHTKYHSGECHCSLVVCFIFSSPLLWYMQTWLKLTNFMLKVILWALMNSLCPHTSWGIKQQWNA